MKKILPLLCCIAALNLSAQDATQAPVELKNQLDSLNYFFGLTLGYSLETAPFETNPELISTGLILAVDGKSEHDAETARFMFQSLHNEMQKDQPGASTPGDTENLEKGKAFLAENGQREGVITTESGLQYEVITLGNGPKPDASSTVEVHYEGKLIDGTVFDSSYKRGETISFPLTRVIKGWTEGVQLMPVGSTYKFYIPSELAYGGRNTGSIPAHSTLIFKIELLGIE
ncbi:MAG: FKBP-type peptidyl-prolyl cis-trans isomerase [Bacteroidota bacterium]